MTTISFYFLFAFLAGMTHAGEYPKPKTRSLHMRSVRSFQSRKNPLVNPHRWIDINLTSQDPELKRMGLRPLQLNMLFL